MKITLKELKKIIIEEVERNNRWMAGFFSGGGISKSNKGVIAPPPGLGDEFDENEDEELNNNEKE